MPHDDWNNERDPFIQRLIDFSDDLSARSDEAIRRADEALWDLKWLLYAPLLPQLDGPLPMEWGVTQEDAPGLVVVRVSGGFTVAGFRAVADEVAAAKDPLCPVLFDKRDIEITKLTPSDLIGAESALHDHIYAFTFCRLGILVRDGEPREVAERWSRLVSSSTLSRIAVFIDESAARDWLAQS